MLYGLIKVAFVSSLCGINFILHEIMVLYSSKKLYKYTSNQIVIPVFTFKLLT
ncbi:hypothetical protein SAMN05421768_10493 [Chryseobacterium joostei]|uniref:Uncharacterized protein n=1 Tax=Chryseobacterium joostei TaxID=112234 RepID=A0A1N7ICE3_9FLAO|nr:hypothetical protein SAMN05421768_10493 [Chryseobacterium joostei]